MMSKFSKDIEDFANLFHTLQIERHLADYDPDARFRKTDVIAYIDAAEAALRAFDKVALKHRRAFAAWVTFRTR